MKTVDEYLSHCYSIPETPPALPLPAEAFAKNWKEAAGKEALDFLTEIIGRNNIAFPLKDKNALRFFFKRNPGRGPSGHCHRKSRGFPEHGSGAERTE